MMLQLVQSNGPKCNYWNTSVGPSICIVTGSSGILEIAIVIVEGLQRSPPKSQVAGRKKEN